MKDVIDTTTEYLDVNPMGIDTAAYVNRVSTGFLQE
jgi:hypothetical protein